MPRTATFAVTVTAEDAEWDDTLDVLRTAFFHIAHDNLPDDDSTDVDVQLLGRTSVLAVLGGTGEGD